MTIQTPIPSSCVEVEYLDRQFGTEVTDEGFSNPTPEIFNELKVKLVNESALLALDPEVVNDKNEVYSAYATDLKRLRTVLQGFEKWVRLGIRCSILPVFNGVSAKEEAEKAATSLWEEMQDRVPQLAKRPLLYLPHTLAAKPVPQLVTVLKEEYTEGVEQVLRTLTCWLQILVDEEFVGLVEWTADDVCRYHFFRYQRERTTLQDKEEDRITFREELPEGQRTLYQRVRGKTVRKDDFQERHVHHIVNARPWGLEEYPYKVPSRVAEFIQGTPGWLRPLVNIVTGTITMEEVIRWKTGSRTDVEEEVISEYTGSPTVAIGPFSFIGWNDADLKKERTCFFWGQAAYISEREAERRETRKIVAVALLVVCALAGFIWWLAERDSRITLENFRTHERQFAGTTLMETGVDELLNIPGLEGIRYGGAGAGVSFGCSICVTLTEEKIMPVRSYTNPDSVALRTVVTRLKMEDGPGTIVYGSADLLPEFGEHLTLHVVKATNKKIVYTLTDRRGSSAR